MYNIQSSPTVTNCTFVNGSTPSMYNMSSSSPTVTNCIFWGGFLSDMIVNSSASPVVTYSAFDTLSYTGTGNITILHDPSPFVDAWGGDLHLKPSSPCIDAGDNSAGLPDTDIDGDARRIDDPAVDDTGNGTKPIVDMGADEYSP
jgi:hypothetical protein